MRRAFDLGETDLAELLRAEERAREASMDLELVDAQSQYLESLTRLELIETELARDRTLFQEGVIAERRLLESQSKQRELTTLVEQRLRRQRLSLRLTGRRIRSAPGCLHHPGEDHREGAGDDARGGGDAHHQSDRAGDARHPEPNDAALHRQVCPDRHHPGFYRGYGYLLGAPAGLRAARRHLGRERTEGPVAISRERGSRMAVAIANVDGRNLVGFVAEARAAVAEQVELPPGYRLEWGGEFVNQQRAAARLALVVPVALVLIFLVLFSTFGSVKQAALVLSNVPFAMIGGVFALALTGEYLSVPASVGFIALLGIAVLNGVVMVAYFNQLRALGRPMQEVVVEGARRRLRPVLMTASIAAFGLVPLLFATGPGSEIQRPLAIVVIGGLVSATLLTLILLPILYRRFGAERV